MNGKEAIETIKSNYPDERYELLREALDLAMECIEKCMRIKELRANELVSEELIDAYVMDKEEWNKYIKNKLCTRLIKSLDESDAIIVTEERDDERHQRIYRAGLEVVL